MEAICNRLVFALCDNCILLRIKHGLHNYFLAKQSIRWRGVATLLILKGANQTSLGSRGFIFTSSSLILEFACLFGSLLRGWDYLYSRTIFRTKATLPIDFLNIHLRHDEVAL